MRIYALILINGGGGGGGGIIIILRRDLWPVYKVEFVRYGPPPHPGWFVLKYVALSRVKDEQNVPNLVQCLYNIYKVYPLNIK